MAAKGYLKNGTKPGNLPGASNPSAPGARKVAGTKVAPASGKGKPIGPVKSSFGLKSNA